MKVMVFFLILVPMIASAHGNRADVTAAAIAEASKVFVASNSKRVKDYKGVKGWIEGAKLRVEIYLQDDTVFPYVCEHTDHDGHMMIVCK
jgi:hypothetical protein